MKLTSFTLAVYFLIGSIFPKTDFSQLASMVNLYDHFLEHQKEALKSGESITFIEFFKEHFVLTDSHSHDDDTHQNLPLNNIHTAVDFYVLKSRPLDILSPSVDNSGKLFYKNELNIFEFTNDLLRPPIRF